MVGLVSYTPTDTGSGAERHSNVYVLFPSVFTRLSFQLLHIWCGSRASWGLAAAVGRLGGRKEAEKEMSQAREGDGKREWGSSQDLRVQNGAESACL